MKGQKHPLWTLALLFAAVSTCFLIGAEAAPVVPRDVARYTFAEYVGEFNKGYSSLGELMRRRTIFEATKRRVMEHNRRTSTTYTIGFNHFADLSDEEISAFLNVGPKGVASSTSRYAVRPEQGTSATLRAMRAQKIRTVHSTRATSIITGDRMDATGNTVPDAFSWQHHDPPILTAVKSQGLCGSCWAHAAAATVESAMALRFGGAVANISVEQLTACANNTRRCGGDGGCYGGTPQLAFAYAARQERGLLSDQDYPYVSGRTGATSTCRWPPKDNDRWARDPPHPIARVKGHVQVERNDVAAVLTALLHRGPLTVTVDATNWIFYHGGIFSDCATGTPLRVSGAGVESLWEEAGNITINHAVQLVGYGVDARTNASFWVVRNSWGVDWGERGYMRLLRASPGEREPCAYVNAWNEVGGGCADDPVVDIVACGMCGILYDAAYPIVADVPVPGGAYWWLPFVLFGSLASVMATLVTCTSLNAMRSRTGRVLRESPT